MPRRPRFCRLEKELNGAISLEDEVQWKVRQNMSYSEIMKWISPTRFVVKEQSHCRVKGHDPPATLGKYGDVEKLELGAEQPVDIYDVSFDAQGECELLPADKSRVISTHPVKK